MFERAQPQEPTGTHEYDGDDNNRSVGLLERGRPESEDNRSVGLLERGRPESVAVVDLDAADYAADSHPHSPLSRTMPSSLLRTLASLRQRSQSQLALRSRLVL